MPEQTSTAKPTRQGRTPFKTYLIEALLSSPFFDSVGDKFFTRTSVLDRRAKNLHEVTVLVGNMSIIFITHFLQWHLALRNAVSVLSPQYAVRFSELAKEFDYLDGSFVVDRGLDQDGRSRAFTLRGLL
jgi:hypothetical protein